MFSVVLASDLSIISQSAKKTSTYFKFCPVEDFVQLKTFMKSQFCLSFKPIYNLHLLVIIIVSTWKRPSCEEY